MSEKWEDELDTALRGLIADVPAIDDTVRARGRAALVTKVTSGKGSPMSVTESKPVEVRAEGPSKRPRRGRWLAAAATVAAVAAGLIVVAETTGPDGNPQTVTAAQVLNRAASNVTELHVNEGQYVYLKHHVWWPTFVSDDTGEPKFVWSDEFQIDSWVPNWGTDLPDMTSSGARITATGERKWLLGTEEEAKEAGAWKPPEGFNRYTAPCFDPDQARDAADPDSDSGVKGNQDGKVIPVPDSETSRFRLKECDPWHRPDGAWIETLPSDPERLLERMRADAREEARPGDDIDDLAFQNAAAALRSGHLPAEVRANLFKAIALLPDIEITERQANLDGRKGTALGMDVAENRLDIIVDYDTGEFIGERQVSTGKDGLEPGTVTAYSALTTAVVDKEGQKPE